MRVTIQGPEDGRETEHTLDAAGATFLMNQLRFAEDRTVFMNGTSYPVLDARLQFFATDEEMTAHVTVQLGFEKPALTKFAVQVQELGFNWPEVGCFCVEASGIKHAAETIAMERGLSPHSKIRVRLWASDNTWVYFSPFVKRVWSAVEIPTLED